MFERLIRFAIEQRWMVLFVTLAMAAVGIYNYSRLSIDAVPDITNVQVQINTAAPGYSPLETEQRVTYPIETVMAGLPGLEQTRSLSRYGLSQVTVIFNDSTTSISRASWSTNDCSKRAKIFPKAYRPRWGRSRPAWARSTSGRSRPRTARKPDGSPYTSTDLREIQDWVVKPQLRNIPGVTEINSIGGYAKEYRWRRTPSSWRPTACR